MPFGRPALIGVDLHDDHAGAVGSLGALERLGQLRWVRNRFCVRAHGPRMRLEVDGEGVGDGGTILDEVVEARLAGVVLQLVDNGEAAIVEDKDDELLACQNRGINVRVHQQIAAVADEDDGVALRLLFHLRNARAEAAGDLITHTGKAELDVDGADLERAPIGGHLGRQATGRCHHPVARVAQRIYDADRLRVGIRPVARRDIPRDIGIPGGAFRLGLGGPVGRSRIAGHGAG